MAGKKKQLEFNSNDNQALFLATITIKSSSENFDVINLKFKDELFKDHLTNDFWIDLVLKNNHKKADTIIDNDKIFYVLSKKTESEYKLSNYELIKDLQLDEAINSDDIQNSVTFSIERGVVNYVGDFVFYPSKNKNGFYFEIHDMLDRDIDRLKRLYQKVDWLTLKNKLTELNNDVVEF